MSKKVLEVEGNAKKDVREMGGGFFHSTHKQEDIEKWLKHMDVEEYVHMFDQVFNCEDEWEEYVEDEEIVSNSFELEFRESEDADEGYCIHDEEIQEFLDEEPQRNRDAGIRSINYQFTDLMGNVQGMKDTALQLLNDFKKVVKTDDVEKLSEKEQKIYQTLTGIISRDRQPLI